MLHRGTVYGKVVPIQNKHPRIGRSFIFIGGLIGISSRHIVGLFHVIPVEVHRRPQRQHQCPQYNMALFDGKFHLAMHSFL